MIALDTNVLVRYLAQDDPAQAARATCFIERELSIAAPGFISIPVLCELLWTLRSRYGHDRDQLGAIVLGLLGTGHLIVDQAELVAQAVGQAPGEITDAIIHAIGSDRGCDRTVTFDRAFAQADGVELLA